MEICMHVYKPSTEGWLGKYEHNTFDNYQEKEYNKAFNYVKNKRSTTMFEKVLSSGSNS